MNAPMPRLKIRYMPIGALKPYLKNARIHSEVQIDQIVRSMQEFGFTNPILIDENGGIIAGHGRLRAAIELDMATVPCVTIAGLTDDQRRALMLADNKLALNATWDETMLAAELTAIGDLAELTGFSEEEILALMSGGTGGMTPEDVRVTLAQRFGLSPFTVFNAREGWWQERKAAWVALGIQSEVGRGGKAGSKLTMSKTVQDLKPSADQALKRSRQKRGREFF